VRAALGGDKNTEVLHLYMVSGLSVITYCPKMRVGKYELDEQNLIPAMAKLVTGAMWGSMIAATSVISIITGGAGAFTALGTAASLPYLKRIEECWERD